MLAALGLLKSDWIHGFRVYLVLGLVSFSVWSKPGDYTELMLCSIRGTGYTIRGNSSLQGPRTVVFDGLCIN